MTQEEFIAVVQRWASKNAAGEAAIKPVGGKPHQVLVTLWDWYTALPERDRTLVRHAMRISAYGALFGVFAMIDGVRQIDDPPHGELRLVYVGPDGTEEPLGGPGPNLNELHSLWAAEAHSPTPSLNPTRSLLHELCTLRANNVRASGGTGLVLDGGRRV